MKLWWKIWSLLRYPLRDREVEAEIEQEIEFHLEMRTHSNERSGMDPERARRDALRRFGDREQVRQQGHAILAPSREVLLSRIGGSLWQDFRFASRLLRRQPSFTGIALLTLALGIGANTAIFSLVDAVLLRPLPYADPQELVIVWEKPPQHALNQVSPATFLDWRAGNQAFEGMAARFGKSLVLTGEDGAQQVTGAQVSSGFFEVLGVRLFQGRTFLPEEEQPGANPVVIISHRLWQGRLGGRANPLGSILHVSGNPYTVVGILPPGSPLERSGADVYLPLTLDPAATDRSNHFLTVYARLKDDVSFSQAQSSMESLASGIAESHPETSQGWSVTLQPLRDVVVGQDLRLTLLALFGSVFLVLLIACLNVANLSLARSARRAREVALRAALGAARLRLLRQFLCENLLIAGGGGILGVLLGYGMIQLFLSWIPAGTLPPLSDVRVDFRLLAFCLGLSFLTAILFGVVPAWRAADQDPQTALREEGRGISPGLGQGRVARALLVLQVALALVLLMGAGLTIRTLWTLQQVDVGFDPSRLLTLHLSLPSGRYPEKTAVSNYLDRVLQEVVTIPGVEEAATALDLPLTGWSWGAFFRVEGQPVDPKQKTAAHLQSVSTDYFRTLRIPLREGRPFEGEDQESSLPVCIINQTLAGRHFRGINPIGRRLLLGSGPDPQALTIVGISGNVRVFGLDPQATTDNPEIYVPARQNPSSSVFLVIRTAGDPASLASSVEKRIHLVDPDQPVTALQTMQDIVGATLADEGFVTLLLGGFALTALFLAAVGTYSMISNTVAGLTQQLGIRRALGATDRQLVRLILRVAMIPILIGLVIGVGASLALGGLIEGMLYGIASSDPVTLMAAALLLTGVALAAAYLPGRRARRVDPIVALRMS